VPGHRLIPHSWFRGCCGIHFTHCVSPALVQRCCWGRGYRSLLRARETERQIRYTVERERYTEREIHRERDTQRERYTQRERETCGVSRHSSTELTVLCACLQFQSRSLPTRDHQSAVWCVGEQTDRQTGRQSSNQAGRQVDHLGCVPSFVLLLYFHPNPPAVPPPKPGTCIALPIKFTTTPTPTPPPPTTTPLPPTTTTTTTTNPNTALP
jgi:hypothetical protein